MKILVLGYYNYGNFGDELFQPAIRRLFRCHDLIFRNIDDAFDENDYELVLFGGGELLNEYFLDRLKLKQDVPIIAFGVGFAGNEIDVDSLWMFDMMVIRNRDMNILKQLNTRFISTNIISIPDIVFSLPLPFNSQYSDRCLFIPSGDRISNHQISRILKKFNCLIFDTKLDGHLPGQHISTLEEFQLQEYNRVVTYKFHGIVLALMNRRLVVCDNQTFKNRELMETVFTHAHKLMFSSSSDTLISDIERCLEYANQNRDRLLEEIDKYLSYVQLFYQQWEDVDILSRLKQPRRKCSPKQVIDKLSNQSFDYIQRHFNLSNNSIYKWGFEKNQTESKHEQIRWLRDDVNKSVLNMRPFNVNLIAHRFDSHRYGWNYVSDLLQGVSSKYGILFDSFLDLAYNSKPYLSPFVGILHHPNNIPIEYSNASLERFVKSTFFKLSKPFCLRLIVLSKHMKDQLSMYLDTNLVSAIYHPMNSNIAHWSFTKWKHTRKCYSIGNWLRNVFSIYQLNYSNKFIIKDHHNIPPKHIYAYKSFSKITYQGCEGCGEGSGPINSHTWLYFANKYFEKLGYQLYSELQPGKIRQPTIESLVEKMIKSVHVLQRLDHNEFDEMISSSVVFLDLIECSASNTLIECIVACTPVYINKLPAVVEYLGEDYPLYYENVDDIHINDQHILNAHEYLKRLDKQQLTSDHFIKSIRNITL